MSLTKFLRSAMHYSKQDKEARRLWKRLKKKGFLNQADHERLMAHIFKNKKCSFETRTMFGVDFPVESLFMQFIRLIWFIASLVPLIGRLVKYSPLKPYFMPDMDLTANPCMAQLYERYKNSWHYDEQNNAIAFRRYLVENGDGFQYSKAGESISIRTMVRQVVPLYKRILFGWTQEVVISMTIPQKNYRTFELCDKWSINAVVSRALYRDWRRNGNITDQDRDELRIAAETGKAVRLKNFHDHVLEHSIGKVVTFNPYEGYRRMHGAGIVSGQIGMSNYGWATITGVRWTKVGYIFDLNITCNRAEITVPSKQWLAPHRQ